MVNVPPMPLAAPVAAIAGHGLQIKACAQIFRGDRLRDDAAVTLIKDAAARYIGRFTPKAPEPFEIAEEVVHVSLKNLTRTSRNQTGLATGELEPSKKLNREALGLSLFT